jgi:hypothetical protein
MPVSIKPVRNNVKRMKLNTMHIPGVNESLVDKKARMTINKIVREPTVTPNGNSL